MHCGGGYVYIHIYIYVMYTCNWLIVYNHTHIYNLIHVLMVTADKHVVATFQSLHHKIARSTLEVQGTKARRRMGNCHRKLRKSMISLSSHQVFQYSYLVSISSRERTLKKDPIWNLGRYAYEATATKKSESSILVHSQQTHPVWSPGVHDSWLGGK